jgi:hypothetical protein
MARMASRGEVMESRGEGWSLEVKDGNAQEGVIAATDGESRRRMETRRKS